MRWLDGRVGQLDTLGVMPSAVLDLVNEMERTSP
jgi:hypothetical protein